MDKDIRDIAAELHQALSVIMVRSYRLPRAEREEAQVAIDSYKEWDERRKAASQELRMQAGYADT